MNELYQASSPTLQRLADRSGRIAFVLPGPEGQAERSRLLACCRPR